MNDSEGDFERIGRIIRLIKIHRHPPTSVTSFLSRDQFLKYYLKPDDWAFWQELKRAAPL